jgi:hypothetical protein
MDRTERIALFIAALKEAQPETDCTSARKLLDDTLNKIEDSHSGASFDPDNWMSDGRMYPPQDDSEPRSDILGARLFYSRGHRLYFGRNGAIRIENRTGPDRGKIVLNKPGRDGGCLH